MNASAKWLKRLPGSPIALTHTKSEQRDLREQYAEVGFVRISLEPGDLLEQCTKLDNQFDELLQSRKIKTKWKNKDGNLKQLVDVHRHSILSSSRVFDYA